MGGIDRNDAMMGNYSLVRKSLKWNAKVAIHFIEEAVINSFILYNKIQENQRFMQFKLTLLRMLLDDATHDSPMFSIPTIGRHFLQLIPPTKRNKTHRKDASFVLKLGKERKAGTHARIALNSQGFAQHPALKNITPKNRTVYFYFLKLSIVLYSC